MPKISFFFLGIFLISFSSLYSQQVISSGGASVSTSNGQMSFVVGQIFYGSIGSNASVSGGILQVPTPKSLVLSTLFESSIRIRPNPIYDRLVIQIEDSNLPLQEISFQIFDLYGRIMESQTMHGLQVTLDMQLYLPGFYTLLIHYPNQKPLPFKLIKL